MPKKKTSDKTASNRKNIKAEQPELDLDHLIAPDSQLEIKLAWKQVQPVYEQVLKQETKKLKLKGFRQGKAPPAVAEKELGTDKIANLVLQKLLPAAYSEAIKAGEHKPLTHPEFQPISINKDNDWVLKVFFAEEPTIELKGYKKSSKKAKKEAQAELEKAIKEQEKDKKKTDKKKGKKEEKEQPPEMTEQQKKDAVVQKILAALVAELQPAIPRLLIKEAAEREMNSFVKRLESMKIELETFLKARQMTQEQLSSSIMMSSIQQLQVEFVLRAIAKKEGLEVEDSEVKETIKKTEDEKMRKQMEKDENYQAYLKQMLLKQKTIEYILDL